LGQVGNIIPFYPNLIQFGQALTKPENSAKITMFSNNFEHIYG
jgi:hypothetical protein